MAAKKKELPPPPPPPKKKAKPVTSENISEHGSLKLSDVQRLTLNWEGAELKSTTSTLRLKRAEYDAFLRKIDPQGIVVRLQSEIASLSATAKMQEEKFINSCKSAGESLGVDPTCKWSYDDMTGIVHMELPPEKKD